MKKILIIEDDVVVATVYRNKFKAEGFATETAADAEAGFALLNSCKPDLVILDLMLPGVGGVDLLRRIRAEKNLKLLPIIVFSNTYLSNLVQEAWKAGATKCLSKANCTPKQLISVVRSLTNSPAPAAPISAAAAGAPAAAVPVAKVSPAKPAPAPATPPAAPAVKPSGFKLGAGAPQPAPALASAPAAKPVPAAETALKLKLVEADNSQAATDSDAAFQAEIRQALMTSFPETLDSARKNLSAIQTELRSNVMTDLPDALISARKTLQTLAKAGDEAGRIFEIKELYRRIHSVTASASLAGMHPVAEMADAFEALLRELHDKPKTINASTLRTVALALDFMGVLFERVKSAKPTPSLSQLHPKILVVDDEALSRRAVTTSLERAKLPSVSLDDPQAALARLSQEKFDLVFLDVDMPGMSGFELCSKLRAQPTNKTTPVIFVTTLNDFESRAHSTMSGGNDLIAKPFLFMELAVKALVVIFRNRINAAG